jgi:hypothetical protein
MIADWDELEEFIENFPGFTWGRVIWVNPNDPDLDSVIADYVNMDMMENRMYVIPHLGAYGSACGTRVETVDWADLGNFIIANPDFNWDSVKWGYTGFAGHSISIGRSNRPYSDFTDVHTDDIHMGSIYAPNQIYASNHIDINWHTRESMIHYTNIDWDNIHGFIAANPDFNWNRVYWECEMELVASLSSDVPRRNWNPANNLPLEEYAKSLYGVYVEPLYGFAVHTDGRFSEKMDLSEAEEYLAANPDLFWSSIVWAYMTDSGKISYSSYSGNVSYEKLGSYDELAGILKLMKVPGIDYGSGMAIYDDRLIDWDNMISHEDIDWHDFWNTGRYFSENPDFYFNQIFWGSPAELEATREYYAEYWSR